MSKRIAPKSRRELTAEPGFCEWLRLGEYERAEEALSDLERLGVRHLRTGFSWADYLSPGGREWFDWLIPKLAGQAELLPCFTYTPPSLGIEAKTSAPPRRTKDYADFLDHALDRYGRHFEYVELWNEPNNTNDWDFMLDPGWQLFREMICQASYWAQNRGYRTVLGGMAPTDPAWLRMMGQQGLLQFIDVVGMHGFPGTWERDDRDWNQSLQSIQDVLDELDSPARIWMTEGGYSTWRHDEESQMGRVLDILDLPVERCYIYQLHDLHPDRPHQAGLREDVKHYHCGLKRADGTPKLVFRLWQEHGIEEMRSLHRGLARTAVRPRPKDRRPVVIIGGAGFIGSNLADRLCGEGHRVRLLDNLSRPGVEWNLLQLHQAHGDLIEADVRDLRDPVAVQESLSDASCVYHFGAQVAVTTSLIRPLEDFSINVEGTLNVLETLRLRNPVPLLFTSTNKVYGALSALELSRKGDRYTPADEGQMAVDESAALDLYTPYGCSKGAADQYVLDYARSFDLPFTVFRMSCIYGPFQWGTEDQGWVAHFVRSAMAGRQLTIYGDGAQVRDLLYVGDLIDVMTRAVRQIDTAAGQAFNMGGGLENSVSLIELLDLIERHLGHSIDVNYAPWRQGDQRYYVSAIGKAKRLLGWEPRTHVPLGIRRLHDWLSSSRFRARQSASSVSMTPQHRN